MVGSDVLKFCLKKWAGKKEKYEAVKVQMSKEGRDSDSDSRII